MKPYPGRRATLGGRDLFFFVAKPLLVSCYSHVRSNFESLCEEEKK